ncbi:hypothetical protein [Corallococcus sp. 4LFB]|uniref:hypothetical protein n=1 Tax=Corallococcus sp. 4LFB TaxID=3383249 RepID=UPI003975378C
MRRLQRRQRAAAVPGRLIRHGEQPVRVLHPLPPLEPARQGSGPRRRVEPRGRERGAGLVGEQVAEGVELRGDGLLVQRQGHRREALLQPGEL